MSTMTYTNRTQEQHVVESIELGDGGTITVHAVGGTTFAFTPDDPEAASELVPTVPFVLECRNGSIVTGVGLYGKWIMHKSDEQVKYEHDKMLSRMRAERVKQLHINRVQWQEREDALPDWIKPRLATFHHRGGFNFSVEGWGYELIIAELAVMYRESGGEDDATIMEYARLHGTSGNQHGVAKMLAKMAEVGESLENTAGALTPLGAHPFYETETGRG